VFREVPLLMKVGVIMMSLALALVLGAVVLSIALRGQPERVVVSEAAKKSPGQASRHSSDKEGRATEGARLRTHLLRGRARITPLGRSRLGTARRPPLVGGRGTPSSKPVSSRRLSSTTKPKPRTLIRQRLNRLATKHIREHPLSLSPNHTTTNPTIKINLFCQRPNKGSDQSLPKES
jgi:hypothetical protein